MSQDPIVMLRAVTRRSRPGTPEVGRFEVKERAPRRPEQPSASDRTVDAVLA